MVSSINNFLFCIVFALSIVYINAYYPTSDYASSSYYGFPVRIHKNAPSKAISLLKMKLNELNDRVNKVLVAVKAARASSSAFNPTFWLDPDGTDAGGAVFHPGVDWLKANGRNPDKVKGIVINGLVFESYLYDQPLMVLHEYAHAFENYLNYPAAIQTAYVAANASGVYNNVKQYGTSGCLTTYCVIDDRDTTGGPAYALSNRNEYFAEATEAFFGVNDFYPYNAFQLYALDPTGYEVVRTTYGLGSTYPPKSFETVTSVADAWQTPVSIKFTNVDASCSVNVYFVSSTGAESLICSNLGPGKQCSQAKAAYSQVYVMKRTTDNVRVSGYVARQLNVELRFSCGNSAVTCTDDNTSCASWAAAGECTKNPGYMLVSCKNSCNACATTTTTTTTTTTPAPTTTTTTISSTCVDMNTSCAYWASIGECSKNPAYMLVYCKKSCNVLC